MFLLAAGDADAQRRRRRRRRRRPPPPAAEPEVNEESGEDTEASEESAQEPAAEDAAPEPPSPAEEPAPSAAPIAEPAEVADVPDAPDVPDLGPLRAELATLMDSLVQTRSRVAVLGRQLFQTKVRIRVENRADDVVLSTFSLRLDGSPVYVMEGSLGDEGEQVFEGFAAPGPHELTVETEQRARASSEYRYLQSDRYRFEVLQGVITEIVITLDDDSDIAEDFEDDGEGEYDVRTRVRVATRELE